MKFSVTFQDVRRPIKLETESIEVDANTPFDAFPIANEIFFTKHPQEKDEDFLVNCPSSG